ncbi:MAG: ribonuclease III [Candidatus Electryoneaceae bacterium]|nr:ribonuclease III [Candidatus Electryoneaceae bacterium]
MFGVRSQPDISPDTSDLLQVEEAMRNTELLLGHQFQNRTLLHQALTHRSVLTETNGDYFHSYERLEFLGDAVLELIVVEYLFQRFPRKHEGYLSKLKSMLVSGEGLERVASKLQLGKHILMSENTVRNGGRNRRSILEDTLEALIGALYLDGGLDTARHFIRKRILCRVDGLISLRTDNNYKSQLLEFLQARGSPPPSYVIVSEEGPDHAKRFKVGVSVGGVILGQGSGSSKKSAQQKAAYVAMEELVK